jgi:hypothetical protein
MSSSTVAQAATNTATPVVVTGFISSQLPVLGSAAWDLASACYTPVAYTFRHTITFEKSGSKSIKLCEISGIQKAVQNLEGIALATNVKVIVEFDSVGQTCYTAFNKEALAVTATSSDIKNMANYRKMTSGVEFSTQNDLTPQTPPSGSMQVKGIPLVGDLLYFNSYVKCKPDADVTLAITGTIVMMGVMRFVSSEVFH